MRRIKLTVEYDGTDFAGFQTQARGHRTVQSVLNAALEKITQETAVIHPAGRTDSGVHALGQVAHFDTQSKVATDRLAGALNALLPRDVSVRALCEVDKTFHARFSALRRTYLYRILSRADRSAVWDRYSLHVKWPLELASMQAAAKAFIGTYDFVSFANRGGNPGSTTVRRIESLSIESVDGGEMLLVRITANAFLRSMVRNIVAALIEAGHGNLNKADVARIIAARSRKSNPCSTAAPHGLFLYKVDYDVHVQAGAESAELDEDEEG